MFYFLRNIVMSRKGGCSFNNPTQSGIYIKSGCKTDKVNIQISGDEILSIDDHAVNLSRPLSIAEAKNIEGDHVIYRRGNKLYWQAGSNEVLLSGPQQWNTITQEDIDQFNNATSSELLEDVKKLDSRVSSLANTLDSRVQQCVDANIQDTITRELQPKFDSLDLQIKDVLSHSPSDSQTPNITYVRQPCVEQDGDHSLLSAAFIEADEKAISDKVNEVVTHRMVDVESTIIKRIATEATKQEQSISTMEEKLQKVESDMDTLNITTGNAIETFQDQLKDNKQSNEENVEELKRVVNISCDNVARAVQEIEASKVTNALLSNQWGELKNVMNGHTQDIERIDDDIAKVKSHMIIPLRNTIGVIHTDVQRVTETVDTAMEKINNVHDEAHTALKSIQGIGSILKQNTSDISCMKSSISDVESEIRTFGTVAFTMRDETEHKLKDVQDRVTENFNSTNCLTNRVNEHDETLRALGCSIDATDKNVCDLTDKLGGFVQQISDLESEHKFIKEKLETNTYETQDTQDTQDEYKHITADQLCELTHKTEKLENKLTRHDSSLAKHADQLTKLELAQDIISNNLVSEGFARQTTVCDLEQRMIDEETERREADAQLATAAKELSELVQSSDKQHKESFDSVNTSIHEIYETLRTIAPNNKEIIDVMDITATYNVSPNTRVKAEDTNLILTADNKVGMTVSPDLVTVHKPLAIKDTVSSSPSVCSEGHLVKKPDDPNLYWVTNETQVNITGTHDIRSNEDPMIKIAQNSGLYEADVGGIGISVNGTTVLEAQDDSIVFAKPIEIVDVDLPTINLGDRGRLIKKPNDTSLYWMSGGREYNLTDVSDIAECHVMSNFIQEDETGVVLGSDEKFMMFDVNGITAYKDFEAPKATFQQLSIGKGLIEEKCGELVYSYGGEQKILSSPTRLNLDEGCQINPSLQFYTGSGLYAPNMEEIAFAFGGSDYIRFGERGMYVKSNHSTPSYSFLDDETSGIGFDKDLCIIHKDKVVARFGEETKIDGLVNMDSAKIDDICSETTKTNTLKANEGNIIHLISAEFTTENATSTNMNTEFASITNMTTKNAMIENIESENAKMDKVVSEEVTANKTISNIIVSSNVTSDIITAQTATVDSVVVRKSDLTDAHIQNLVTHDMKSKTMHSENARLVSLDTTNLTVGNEDLRVRSGILSTHGPGGITTYSGSIHLEAGMDLKSGDIVGISPDGSGTVTKVLGGKFINEQHYMHTLRASKWISSNQYDMHIAMVSVKCGECKCDCTHENLMLTIDIITGGIKKSTQIQLVKTGSDIYTCSIVSVDQNRIIIAYGKYNSTDSITIKKILIEVHEGNISLTVESTYTHTPNESVEIFDCVYGLDNIAQLDILTLICYHSLSGNFSIALFAVHSDTAEPIELGYASNNILDRSMVGSGKTLRVILIPGQIVVVSYGNVKFFVMLSSSYEVEVSMGNSLIDKDSSDCVDMLYDETNTVIMSLERTITNSAIIRVLDIFADSIKIITSKKLKTESLAPIGFGYNSREQTPIIFYAESDTDAMISAQLFKYSEEIRLGIIYDWISAKHMYSTITEDYMYIPRFSNVVHERIDGTLTFDYQHSDGYSSISFGPCGVSPESFIGFVNRDCDEGDMCEIIPRGQIFTAPEQGSMRSLLGYISETYWGKHIYVNININGSFPHNLTNEEAGNVFVGTCITGNKILVGL